MNWADKVEPSRCQETAVAAVGAGTGGTKNVGGRLMDCNKKSTTARTLPTNCGEFVKPISGLVPPVVTKMAPTDGTGVMHYQWIVRESVRTTEMLMPSNYLEIPELRLPRVFLHLAEEARNVEVGNDLSCCLEEVQPQGTRLTVMVDSQPIPNKRVLRTTGPSTEMMTNIKYVGRCKPMDWVVSPGTTKQPVLLGLNTDARGNASADAGGPDVNSAKQGEPMDRSGPVGPQSTTEQSALLGLKTDGTENTPVYSGGPDMILAGQVETVDRPVLVGSHNRTEQSVFLGLDVDQVEHVPASTVDPEVMMYCDQSFADRPGQDETRRRWAQNGCMPKTMRIG